MIEARESNPPKVIIHIYSYTVGNSITVPYTHTRTVTTVGAESPTFRRVVCRARCRADRTGRDAVGTTMEDGSVSRVHALCATRRFQTRTGRCMDPSDAVELPPP